MNERAKMVLKHLQKILHMQLNRYSQKSLHNLVFKININIVYSMRVWVANRT